MKYTGIIKFLAVGFFISLTLLFQACKDNEPLSENTYVNKWIYENMDFLYYWNTQLPSKPNRNQDAETFFKSLLSNEDRFSVIYDDYEEILSALDGVKKESGYEYVLYRESEANPNVIAQVLYIKTGSPAASTALKRGDIITHINGQQITLDNYKSLVEQTGENHSITYRPITVTSSSTGSFGSPITLSLNSILFEENPNYYTSIIDVDGKKVGYYVYHFFTPGIGEGSEYNNQMDQIMADFKTQGVTDLIVDLRYNGGGYVDASINLASLIGKNIDNTKVFTKREYNTTVTNYFNFQEADLVERFISKTQNIGNSMPGNLYILTGSMTASASELIINGLRPFMNVTLIGEVTVGKNVGSVPVYEENDPKNRWIMLPIIVKSFNSNNQSGYGNGFIPELTIEEGTYLYPLGDLEEPLLSAALAQVAASSGKFTVSKTRNLFAKKLGSSQAFRNRGIRSLLIERKPFTGIPTRD